jgi:hypothetical protein
MFKLTFMRTGFILILHDASYRFEFTSRYAMDNTTTVIDYPFRKDQVKVNMLEIHIHVTVFCPMYLAKYIQTHSTSCI